ncbi:MAG: DUF2779 domain-containing protein, partial [Thiomonas sp.]
RTLSKSKLMAFRQCPRRLWLEVHAPERKQDSAQTQSSYRAGLSVGDIARRLYDPQQQGTLIDLDTLGFPAVFDATAQAMRQRWPIFEAAFSAGGGLALADVLLPVGDCAWRMIEVKSSTSVKDPQREDLAVQSYIVSQAGVQLAGTAIAHIDASWVYPGGGDYTGLLTEVDLTDEMRERMCEVPQWINQAQAVVDAAQMPCVKTGAQCNDPYPCGFYAYCYSLEPKVEYPIQWLPRFPAQRWVDQGVADLRDLPDEALNPLQQRVRDCTLRGEVFFDREGAAADLARYPLPAVFLDFETIQFAVPIWAGTRPYQQIPFQYSVHRLDTDRQLTHSEFLDLSGQDPSRAFAERLIRDCGTQEPVFVYNAAFEKTRLRELAERFPDLAGALQAIADRVVDLLPIARQRYYHPAQQGSWSIKAVLPAAVPELSYAALDGVQDGSGAQEAFLEAIAPDTDPRRKAELEKQLLAYCALDTYAMVRLWEVLAGSDV